MNHDELFGLLKTIDPKAKRVDPTPRPWRVGIGPEYWAEVYLLDANKERIATLRQAAPRAMGPTKEDAIQRATEIIAAVNTYDTHCALVTAAREYFQVFGGSADPATCALREALHAVDAAEKGATK